MKFEEIKSVLSECSVGIAGAGGLGSNCAAALVRIGLGHLVIVDFDRIEESNLNRQYYFRDQIGQPKVVALKDNLLRINPFLDLTISQEVLIPGNIPDFFEDVDLLIEAFDKADQKAMLIETALAVWPDRPVISGSGLAGYGDFASLQIVRSGSLYICGDQTHETGDETPPIAPRVGIVSHMQANLALELLLNLNSPVSSESFIS
ncbi:MAG: sulfur carrier protein ThiS adenylyltransferase ThiF [Bacteroidales bacterium]|nr:sulfur carrier protein ThiS adenylyltransferase ThiF [Bacteroidales bacterium]